MVRNFPGPPDSHLLHREPLRTDELDREVIRGMTGFEFGTEDDIERRLVSVLESEPYRRAVEARDSARNGTLNGKISSWVHGESYSSVALSGSVSADSVSRLDPSVSPSPSNNNASTPNKKSSKRFSGFDFYRRKLFSPSSSPPGTPTGKSPPQPPPVEPPQNREPVDPTRGFHPLISIYYLVREKLEREKVYGPGHFASSQLSLVGDAATAAAAAAAVTADAPAPPPKSAAQPTITLSAPPKKADYNMPLPRLPAPEASHYSGMSHDVSHAQPSTPSTPAHPQPRAKTDEMPMSPQIEGNRTRGEMASATLPRAPPASTHRRSHSLSQRPSVMRGWGAQEPPRTAGPEMVTFAQREAIDVSEKPAEEEKETQKEPEPEKQKEQEKDSHKEAFPLSPTATIARRFGTLLGRDDGRKSKRLSLSLSASPRPSVDRSAATPTVEKEGGLVASLSQPIHRRAATILDPKSHDRKHERRGSMGSMSRAMGAQWANRRDGGRPSTAMGTVGATGASTFARTDAGKWIGKTEEEKEKEEDDDAEKRDTNGHVGHKEEGSASASEKDEVKPIYLKGLFSVATTSTKSAQTIKADVRKVLDRMQVQYREIRGGFECAHLPSIDLSSVTSGGGAINGAATLAARRSVAKKPSKINFGKRSKEKERERKETTESQKEKERDKGKGKVEEGEKDLPTRPVRSPSGDSSSFFNPTQSPPPSSFPLSPSQHSPSTNTLNTVGTANGEVIPESPSQTEQSTVRAQSPLKSTPPKFLPPIPIDFAASPTKQVPIQSMNGGEVDADTFEAAVASGLCVRFEINIVKVCMIGLLLHDKAT
jgi:hypothetical protein